MFLSADGGKGNYYICLKGKGNVFVWLKVKKVVRVILHLH